MLQWNDRISAIPELNAAQLRAVRQYGAHTIGDLLSVLPRRYDDYTRCVEIAHAPVGVPVTLHVIVQEVKKAPGFRRRITMIRGSVSDQSGTLKVIWFNQPWLLEALKPGRDIYLSGTITFKPRFGRQMSNPIWEPIESIAVAGSLAPVYPLTGSVAQKTMRELMANIVNALGEIPDSCPPHIRSRFATLSLQEAYRSVHRPVTSEEAERGRSRLAFDELLAYRLALDSAKEEANRAGAPRIPFDEAFAKKFVAELPFTMTDDQKRASWAAFKDMDQSIPSASELPSSAPMAGEIMSSVPMRRLLQGDVGSGKTVVAAFLMAMCQRSGQSSVLMAPTEILAKQHATSLRRYLSVGESLSLLLLTSSEKRLWEAGEEKKLSAEEVRSRVAAGRIAIVGTHALLSHGMMPADTALAIVDEQHRFGVEQREALTVAHRPDGLVPHLLSMTATPIPRSLELTFFGDLDVSIIRTKPAGRRPIKTRVFVGEERIKCYETIREEVKKGNRVFIVCPLIDESDTLGVKSVTAEAKRLAADHLNGLRIGVLHGKMSPKDKDGVMGEFTEGLIDVLISTTVVEVGVDVPEATVMAIEAAERFGLAQLHQLRGRVGRSDRPSFCFLLTDTGGESLERLRVLEKTEDGFVIAEEDIKRRGSGNLLGLEQSGKSLFRSARSSDLSLMVQAKEASDLLLKESPDLSAYPDLRRIVQSIQETGHQE
jgi:ATP-dependent DNA helicase RecG